MRSLRHCGGNGLIDRRTLLGRSMFCGCHGHGRRAFRGEAPLFDQLVGACVGSTVRPAALVVLRLTATLLFS
jgi:hypothetical protein